MLNQINKGGRGGGGEVVVFARGGGGGDTPSEPQPLRLKRDCHVH